MWIPALFVALIALGWVFWPRKRHMTRDEVVVFLEKWVADTLTAGEWDYFECCELRNPQLESLRRRCAAISLDPSLTFNPQSSSQLNAAGVAEVRLLILEVRGQGEIAA